MTHKRGAEVKEHPVFTIGHSNHRAEYFFALLSKHRVTVVADVRSAPYSRFSPHFNQGALADALEARSIRYVYGGRELGGRPNDPTCYDDGRVSYERVARTADFQEGIARIVRGAAEHRIALMCAEKEPLDCHRTLLVARALDEQGIEVVHILAGGDAEPHAKTMDRLMAKFGMRPGAELFPRSRRELVEEAIARQTGRAAVRVVRAKGPPSVS